MINRNKIYLPIFSSLALLLSTACEPQPKMVSYGSNEYGQLEFEGTSWDHEPLHEGYLNAGQEKILLLSISKVTMEMIFQFIIENFYVKEIMISVSATCLESLIHLWHKVGLIQTPCA